jgi:outer membrane protein TolC
MRIQTESERQAAERTLKEVMQKLEEALRLSRSLQDQGVAPKVRGRQVHAKGERRG